MSRAGKKQDHDCPFNTRRHRGIAIFGKTLTQRFYLRAHKSGSGLLEPVVVAVAVVVAVMGREKSLPSRMYEKAKPNQA
jgi:hypothetical protein